MFHRTFLTIDADFCPDCGKNPVLLNEEILVITIQKARRFDALKIIIS